MQTGRGRGVNPMTMTTMGMLDMELYEEFLRDARQLDNIANAMLEYTEEEMPHDTELLRLLQILTVASSNVMLEVQARIALEAGGLVP